MGVAEVSGVSQQDWPRRAQRVPARLWILSYWEVAEGVKKKDDRV